MSFVLAQDSTNPNAIPTSVLAAGYTTGVGIQWPPSGWALHPNAIRICQDFGATDTTADVLDVETGAATPAQVPAWYTSALANRVKGVRPGQRFPCIYVNRSNITQVANALVAAGIKTHGPALWLAFPGQSLTQAEPEITDQQPYPLVGIQYAFAGSVDDDVFLDTWVNSTGEFALATPPPVTPPPTLTAYQKGSVGLYLNGNQLEIYGVGQDNRLYVSDLDPATGVGSNTRAVTAPLNFQ